MNVRGPYRSNAQCHTSCRVGIITPSVSQSQSALRTTDMGCTSSAREIRHGKQATGRVMFRHRKIYGICYIKVEFKDTEDTSSHERERLTGKEGDQRERGEFP